MSANGGEMIVLQLTPLAINVLDPSSVILPSLIAELNVIFVISFEDITGVWSFLQPITDIII
jgi:hypothetical protein